MRTAGSALALALLLGGGCAHSVAPGAARSSITELPAGDARLGQGACRTLSWPVVVPVSSGFGRRDGRMHLGVDLVVPTGTPVRAACDGVVAYAGEKLRGYGRLLIIKHGGGLTTVYAHNHELLVAEGAPVGRGQVIARSGATGRVTAPHLHFEVRVDGKATDPLPYLPNPLGPPRLQAMANW